jgi:hypothetical protein
MPQLDTASGEFNGLCSPFRCRYSELINTRPVIGIGYWQSGNVWSAIANKDYVSGTKTNQAQFVNNLKTVFKLRANYDKFGWISHWILVAWWRWLTPDVGYVFINRSSRMTSLKGSAISISTMMTPCVFQFPIGYLYLLTLLLAGGHKQRCMGIGPTRTLHYCLKPLQLGTTSTSCMFPHALLNYA